MWLYGNTLFYGFPNFLIFSMEISWKGLSNYTETDTDTDTVQKPRTHRLTECIRNKQDINWASFTSGCIVFGGTSLKDLLKT